MALPEYPRRVTVSELIHDLLTLEQEGHGDAIVMTQDYNDDRQVVMSWDPHTPSVEFVDDPGPIGIPPDNGVAYISIAH